MMVLRRKRQTLLEDIKLMHTDAAFVDMVFVCGEEEEEIGACRMVAACRSPVLKSMLLTSGMAESKLHRVQLPSIAPATMRICLEFFYTDTVHESSWALSFSLAMKVVEAAVFFIVKPLQRLAITYMSNLFSSISEGEGHVESIELVQTYNAGAQILAAQQNKMSTMRSLLDMLRSGIHSDMSSDARQERYVYKSLSQHAIAHFIQVPLPVYQGPLCGYFSFVSLVKWIAHRLAIADASIKEDEVENMLKRCFPESLNQIASASNIDADDADTSQLMKVIRKPLAEILQTASIDFASIPTDLLCKVIEPLDVIPPSALLQAYKCQALCRPKLQWDQFLHGELYNIEANDPAVISCEHTSITGFARCSTYLNATNMACFAWRIVMLSPCAEFRVGLCVCGPSFRTSNCKKFVLGAMEGSWALNSDGLLLHTNSEENIQACSFLDVSFPTKKAVAIEVHVDMVTMSCSFAIDGNKAKIAWENMHTNGYPVYPAISLQKPGKARLEMACHKWMDCPSKPVQFSDSVVMSS